MNLMTAFTAETAYGSYGRRDRIHVRRGIIGCGTGFTVGLDEKGNIHYAGENRWGQKQAAEWQDLLSVFCGPDYILGLCRDGTVLSAGRSHDHGIDTQSWACVTVISCGQTHAAALIGNGQVMTSGSNRYGQCQTSSWSDMVDVCCGKRFTVGLRQDGRLKMAGGTKLLHQAVENLPERERIIMRLRFGLSGGRALTQKEVADRIGISQSYISRLEKRIIRQLGRTLREQEV